MNIPVDSQRHPRISVVIVSYNTRDLLADCLNSLREFEPESQVIVVDNASRDGSESMVRERFPDVTIIQTGRNAGFAGANNLGIAQATGDFVVLLNSDTRLLDPALTAAAKWLEEHPDVGATSPKLLGPDNLPQSCVYAWPSVGALWREALKLPSRQPKIAVDGWLAGTCLILRKAALADAADWTNPTGCTGKMPTFRGNWSIVDGQSRRSKARRFGITEVPAAGATTLRGGRTCMHGIFMASTDGFAKMRDSGLRPGSGSSMPSTCPASGFGRS